MDLIAESATLPGDPRKQPFLAEFFMWIHEE